MGDDIAEKRLAVSNAYSNQAWKKKVQNMTDQQVIAIFLRLRANNKI